MGLLDSINLDDPKINALMGLGQGLLASGGPSAAPVSVGQGLAAGLGGMQRAYQQSIANKLEVSKADLMKLQMDLIKKQIATKENAGKALMDDQTQSVQQQAPIPLQQYSPSVTNAFGIGQAAPQVQQPSVDSVSVKPVSYGERLIAAARKAGDADLYQEGMKMLLEEKKASPKFKAETGYALNPSTNRLEMYGTDDNGGIKWYGVAPKPNMKQMQLGNRIEWVNEDAVKPGETYQVGTSPDTVFNASKPQFHEGAWFTVPSKANPAGAMITPSGSIAPKGTPERQKQDANKVLTLLDEADKELNKSTGSYIGTGVDLAGDVLGFSTPGAIAGAKLKAIQGAIMMNQPRMEGPQSDKDVALYREMAGRIGDTTIPIGQRQAALQTVRELQQKYAGLPSAGTRKATGTIDFGQLPK